MAHRQVIEVPSPQSGTPHHLVRVPYEIATADRTLKFGETTGDGSSGVVGAAEIRQETDRRVSLRHDGNLDIIPHGGDHVGEVWGVERAAKKRIAPLQIRPRGSLLCAQFGGGKRLNDRHRTMRVSLGCTCMNSRSFTRRAPSREWMRNA